MTYLLQLARQYPERFAFLGFGIAVQVVALWASARGWRNWRRAVEYARQNGTRRRV